MVGEWVKVRNVVSSLLGSDRYVSLGVKDFEVQLGTILNELLDQTLSNEF